MMQVIQHPNARTFLDATRSFLEPAQAECGLLYGLAMKSLPDEVPDPAETLFIHIEDESGKPRFAILRMGRPGVLIFGNPNGWEAAVEHVLPGIRKFYPEISALHGPADQVVAVANAAGQAYKIDTEQGLYRLDTLIPPRSCPGKLRQATMDDHDLIMDWYCAFLEEVMNETVTREAISQTIEGVIGSQSYWLWEDGKRVAMTSVTRNTGRGITIGYVYTPPESRGKGYASNVTAAVTRLMLEERGLEFCTLFTDMANPTSNKIYQAIGYYKISDFLYLSFQA
jgi:hypothetical protein